jgi:hypothetical protein
MRLGTAISKMWPVQVARIKKTQLRRFLQKRDTAESSQKESKATFINQIEIRFEWFFGIELIHESLSHLKVC